MAATESQWQIHFALNQWDNIFVILLLYLDIFGVTYKGISHSEQTRVLTSVNKERIKLHALQHVCSKGYTFSFFIHEPQEYSKLIVRGIELYLPLGLVVTLAHPASANT